MVEKKLLEVRSQIKSRKPTYKRVQANQFAKLKNKGASWRKPKGMGNKVRRGRRGQPSMPEVGFGSPKSIRGLNKDGFKEVIVSNVADLAKINTKEEVAVISRTVGSRKKVEILAEAKKLKLTVSNVKDVDETIKSLTKEKKVEKKTEAPAKKTTKKEEAKK